MNKSIKDEKRRSKGANQVKTFEYENEMLMTIWSGDQGSKLESCTEQKTLKHKGLVA